MRYQHRRFISNREICVVYQQCDLLRKVANWVTHRNFRIINWKSTKALPPLWVFYLWSLLFFILLDFHLNLIIRKCTPHLAVGPIVAGESIYLHYLHWIHIFVPAHSYLSCEIFLFEQMVLHSLVSLFLVKACFFFPAASTVLRLLLWKSFFYSVHNLLGFKAFHVSWRLEDFSVMCVWFYNFLFRFQPFVTLKPWTPYLTFFPASLNYFED